MHGFSLAGRRALVLWAAVARLLHPSLHITAAQRANTGRRDKLDALRVIEQRHERTLARELVGSLIGASPSCALFGERC